MVHLKLTRKGIKRLITTMALIAPIIYLFGTQFTALNGAHGDDVLAYGDDVITNVEEGYLNQVVDTADVDSVLFSGLVPISISDNVIYIEDGTYDMRPAVSGEPRIYYSIPLSFTYSWIVGHSYLFYGEVSGVNSPSGLLAEMVSLTVSSPYKELHAGTAEIFSMTSNNYFLPRLYFYSDVYSFEDFSAWFNVVDLTLLYGDDIPSMQVIREEYPFINRPFNLVGEHVYRYEYGTSYSGDLFQHMFGKYNILTEIGRDAVSDNPHGFAPFGAMLKFVDDNMLHLADTDIGLMGYGYFYYSAHVLLFVLMFDLTTFFIYFVNKLGDRFAGGMKDD